MVSIGISGAHSVGKSVTMNVLKKKYPALNLVSEAARNCPYTLNEKTTFQSQDWILREQIRKEVAVPFSDITISDRTVYDQLAYSRYAYNHSGMTFTEFDMLEKRILAWGKTYDLIVYFPIQFDLVCDGVRSTDTKYREEIDELIINTLESHAPNRFITIKGEVEERASKIERELLKLTSGFDHGE